jgi:hypothetical protein
VALAAHLYPNFGFGAFGFKAIAAGTGNCGRAVFGVDTVFHGWCSFLGRFPRFSVRYGKTKNKCRIGANIVYNKAAVIASVRPSWEWLVRVVYESEKALTGALNSLFWAVPFSKI